MPKMKTRRTVKKRISVTGRGQLRRHRATMSHYLGKKTQKRIRHNRQETEVSPADERTILRLLGK